jgi:hypothetical protein
MSAAELGRGDESQVGGESLDLLPPGSSLGGPGTVDGINLNIQPPVFFQSSAFPQKRRTRRAKTDAPKPKDLPSALNGDGPESNAAYSRALEDPSLIIEPQRYGFYPSGYWLDQSSTFGDLVSKFFQRKNNSNCRFPHKLYNALLIVDADPRFYPLTGVQWVNDSVFKVDKILFGRLLGISSFDGGLFHAQGNFPSHGFKEVTIDLVEQLCPGIDLSDLDFDRVRLITHATGHFVRNIDEGFVGRIKWTNPTA